MIVFILVFLLFSYSHDQIMVLKALNLYSSLRVFRLFCLQASFCLHANKKMEYFLYFRRLTICMYTIAMIVSTLKK